MTCRSTRRGRTARRPGGGPAVGVVAPDERAVSVRDLLGRRAGRHPEHLVEVLLTHRTRPRPRHGEAAGPPPLPCVGGPAAVEVGYQVAPALIVRPDRWGRVLRSSPAEGRASPRDRVAVMCSRVDITSLRCESSAPPAGVPLPGPAVRARVPGPRPQVRARRRTPVPLPPLCRGTGRPPGRRRLGTVPGPRDDLVELRREQLVVVTDELQELLVHGHGRRRGVRTRRRVGEHHRRSPARPSGLASFPALSRRHGSVAPDTDYVARPR